MEGRNFPNPDYPQDLKELFIGAMLLLDLKNKEIDQETAIDLERMKKRVLSGKAKITECDYEDELEMLKGKKGRTGGVVIRNGEDSVGNYDNLSIDDEDQNRKFKSPKCSKAEYEHDHGKLKGQSHKTDERQFFYHGECSNSNQDRNWEKLEHPTTEQDRVLEKLKRKKNKAVSFANDTQTPPRRDNQDDDSDQNHPFPVHPLAESEPSLIEKYSKPVEKILTASDVSNTLQRLQFSKKDAPVVFAEVLSPEEKENLPDGVRVIVYGTKSKRGYPMVYKYWNTSPVLAMGWKDFYVGEELECGDHVTLWMFRDSVTKELSFLFSSRKPQREEEEKE